MYAILTNEPKPVAELPRPDLPDDLARVIRRGLKRDQTERYRDALALLSDLGVERSRFGGTSSGIFDAGQDRHRRPVGGLHPAGAGRTCGDEVRWIAGAVGLVARCGDTRLVGLNRDNGVGNGAGGRDRWSRTDRSTSSASCPLPTAPATRVSTGSAAVSPSWSPTGWRARSCSRWWAPTGWRLWTRGIGRRGRRSRTHGCRQRRDASRPRRLHGVGAGSRAPGLVGVLPPAGSTALMGKPAALRRRSRRRGAPRPRSAPHRAGRCPHRGLRRRQSRGLLLPPGPPFFRRFALRRSRRSVP